MIWGSFEVELVVHIIQGRINFLNNALINIRVEAIYLSLIYALTLEWVLESAISLSLSEHISRRVKWII